MLKNILIVSSLAFGLAAPAANAQSRDMGAGRLIAAQGNQALQMIKAEWRQTLKVLAPAFPRKPAAKKMQFTPVNGVAAAVPSTSAGGNRSFSMTPAAVRCAE